MSLICRLAHESWRIRLKLSTHIIHTELSKKNYSLTITYHFRGRVEQSVGCVCMCACAYVSASVTVSGYPDNNFRTNDFWRLEEWFNSRSQDKVGTGRRMSVEWSARASVEVFLVNWFNCLREYSWGIFMEFMEHANLKACSQHKNWTGL